jgi:AcrR family transcriptional regulator
LAITGSRRPALTADSAPAVTGHRERLLAGLAAALREQSYGEVTVADVVRHARTSRRTFYEHFADKQTCLIALLQEETDQTVARIAAAVNPRAPWQAQVRQAIEAWITGVTDDPGVRLCWIRVVPSLGDAARPLLRRTMAAFADLIAALAQSPDLASTGVTPPSRQETIMLLGGLKELIATTVEDGGDPRGMIDIATTVAIRILDPHGGDDPGSPWTRSR